MVLLAQMKETTDIPGSLQKRSSAETKRYQKTVLPYMGRGSAASMSAEKVFSFWHCSLVMTTVGILGSDWSICLNEHGLFSVIENVLEYY